jgi:cellulose synthase/poly-beta-1,6-N-acetylglucosamine synthase-like glycosyltransferase
VNDDSYLAWAAARKGLIVRLATSIETDFVYPKNILDYLEQRKRWLFGHMQMKKITGEFPRVLEFSLTSQPKVVLEALNEQLRQDPRNILYLFAGLLLEVVAFGAILVGSLSSKRYAKWNVIASTKRFPGGLTRDCKA